MSPMSAVKASTGVLPVIMVYEHPSDSSSVCVAVPGLDSAEQAMVFRIMAEAIEAAGASGYRAGNFHVGGERSCVIGRISAMPDGRHSQFETTQRLLKELENAARRESTVRTALYPRETRSHDVTVLR